jgi:hypothetical protein
MIIQAADYIAGILEKLMLRRIAAFAGFYGPIIELTKHVLVSIEVPFPAEHQEALDRAKQVAQPHEHSRGFIYPPVSSTAEPYPCIEYELGVRAFKSALFLYISHQFQCRHRHPFKMARCSINYAHLRREHGRTAKWEAVNPGYQYKRVNNSYFRDSYKQRAFATIPGLALLLERKNTEEDLGLTGNIITNRGITSSRMTLILFTSIFPCRPPLVQSWKMLRGSSMGWVIYNGGCMTRQMGPS